MGEAVPQPATPDNNPKSNTWGYIFTFVVGGFATKVASAVSKQTVGKLVDKAVTPVAEAIVAHPGVAAAGAASAVAALGVGGVMGQKLDAAANIDARQQMGLSGMNPDGSVNTYTSFLGIPTKLQIGTPRVPTNVKVMKK